MNDSFSRIVVLAPNWLGDAVMALPAIADVRRTFPSARFTIAARRSVADIFRLVPFIDDVVPLEWKGRWWRRAELARDAERLRALRADLALLLPNSFAAAWLVQQADIPARWGFAADMRSRLLTRHVPRPAGSMHHGAYYQYLTRELDIDSGPLEPALTVPASTAEAAHRLLVDSGWDPSRPLVGFAPGAAYGTAKRWIPAYVARAASGMVRDRRASCAIVGSDGDKPTVAQILHAIDAEAVPHILDLTGRTSLELLAGVIAAAAACVSNDSGAMHLAAAIGTPVVALFGPTNEYETSPLTREGRRAAVLTHPVWCRPCMLRECPIDHRCMKRIAPARVTDALERLMAT